MKIVNTLAILVFILSSTPVWAADAVAGKTNFDSFCATCHGAGGKGDGPGAAGLDPKPRDLTATTKTDDQLLKVIKEGGAANGLSPLMIAWGGVLTDDDIKNVIAYIRTLKK